MADPPVGSVLDTGSLTAQLLTLVKYFSRVFLLHTQSCTELTGLVALNGDYVSPNSSWHRAHASGCSNHTKERGYLFYILCNSRIKMWSSPQPVLHMKFSLGRVLSFIISNCEWFLCQWYKRWKGAILKGLVEWCLVFGVVTCLFISGHETCWKCWCIGLAMSTHTGDVGPNEHYPI